MRNVEATRRAAAPLKPARRSAVHAGRTKAAVPKPGRPRTAEAGTGPADTCSWGSCRCVRDSRYQAPPTDPLPM